METQIICPMPYLRQIKFYFWVTIPGKLFLIDLIIASHIGCKTGDAIVGRKDF